MGMVNLMASVWKHSSVRGLCDERGWGVLAKYILPTQLHVTSYLGEEAGEGQ